MVFAPLTRLLALAATITVVYATPRVDPGIHRTLRKQGSVNLFVTMTDGTRTVLNRVQEAQYASRGERIAQMVDALEMHSAVSQSPIEALLAQEATSGDSVPLFSSKKHYWISNQVFFEGATFELVEKLAQLPSVKSMHEGRVFRLLDEAEAHPSLSSAAMNGSVATAEWGIERVRAPEVWASGNTGQDVIVASIDCGVRGTHESLKANFRGEYGWFDPQKKTTAPYDDYGHGTHTMGTLAGGNGIGVAPGAKWMTCKGCRGPSCLEEDLLACAEFFVCPTDTQGLNRDCSKAPRIVSNSWGGIEDNQWFVETIDIWRAAGILPIFGAGNSGPRCESVVSPSDYPTVIGVGSIDIANGIALSAGRGPSLVDGGLKPEVSAPGESILSAGHSGDALYIIKSGTSMATPHVSGVVALLLQEFPNLSYDEVKSFITTSTIKSLLPADRVCAGTPNGVFPNNMYGHGLINAPGTIAAARAAHAAGTQ